MLFQSILAGIAEIGGESRLDNRKLLGLCFGIGSWELGKVMREQRVRLFRNGRNQAVRIPREFEFPGRDAVNRKKDERLVIEAAPAKSLLEVLTKLAPLEDNFPPIHELSSNPVKF